MLSCTEFIPAYSALFQYIENQSGEAAVRTYWEHISDTYVQERLGGAVRQEGIRGCYTYWTRSLNEEAADFTITFDEDASDFEIVMHHCPSKGMLDSVPQIKPYHNYCGHCDTLYRRVLEAEGLSYEFDGSRVADATCRICVRKQAK